ncbi:hypothetical protein MXM12_00620 [Staphylococcus haemolyticus]|uniref:hypothetical protein n=1 Tax=Staphylococcus haemolyticus TaxID=1283 RepID=UPI002DB95894|nr:hypothetical protein [Staphylococcus haemolyticus]MEB6259772.1 hypothetical protein [Staphylococcus haemolyticus]
MNVNITFKNGFFNTYDRFIILAVAIWFKKALESSIFKSSQGPSKEKFIKKFYKLSKLGFGPQQREFYKEILQAKQAGVKTK